MKITKIIEKMLFSVLIIMLFFVVVVLFYTFVIYNIFAKPQCQSEYELLDDLQYLDNNNLIFSFGEKRIISIATKKEYLIGEIVEIQRCVNPEWFLIPESETVRIK